MTIKTCRNCKDTEGGYGTQGLMCKVSGKMVNDWDHVCTIQNEKDVEKCDHDFMNNVGFTTCRKCGHVVDDHN